MRADRLDGRVNRSERMQCPASLQLPFKRRTRGDVLIMINHERTIIAEQSEEEPATQEGRTIEAANFTRDPVEGREVHQRSVNPSTARTKDRMGTVPSPRPAPGR